MRRLDKQVYAVEPTQPDEGKRPQSRPPKPKPEPEPPKYAPDDPRARYPMRFAQHAHQAEMQHHARDEAHAVIWRGELGFEVVPARGATPSMTLYVSRGMATRECERHLNKGGK